MKDAFDLLVIGGGSGGIACARRAAQHGARVAVAESARLGGTCVNVGCVPKKIMWHAAQLRHGFDDAADYGFSQQPASLDWGRLVARREAYLRRLNGIYATNLERDGVSLLEGRARFVDAARVSVGSHTVSAERVLIASGSTAVWPDLPGAGLGMDSNGFFALQQQPRRVTIVGSGYIAVELAGMLRALGSQVSLLVRGSQLIRAFDGMLGEVLASEMQAAGIDLRFSTQAAAVEQVADGLQIKLDDGQELATDALIWAIGRAPDIGDLNLEAAGLSVGARGEVPVDEWQATAQPHVFAVGDVTGAPELTPVAIAAGRRLADRLYDGQVRSKMDYSLIPTVVFSHPPIATVGLSEAAARERFGDDCKIWESRFKSLYYGIVDHKVQSAMKLITVGADQKVVGLHSIGPGSDELLQGFAVAISMGATKRDFDNTVAIHPTVSEEFVTLR